MKLEPSEKGDTVAVEIALPDRKISNRIKVRPPGTETEEELKVRFVPFPVADPALLVDDQVTCVIQIKGKVRDRIEVPADISEYDLRELVLAREKVVAATGAGIRTVVVRAPGLVNVVPV